MIPVESHTRLPFDNDVATLGHNRDYTFHQTGSWFFCCERADSDVDFITEHSEQVIEWLASEGFKRMGGTKKEYSVPETQTEGVYQKGRVQVQVVYNLKATLIARDVLSKHFATEHKKSDGPVRREVWTRIIKALDDVDRVFSFGNVRDLDLF